MIVLKNKEQKNFIRFLNALNGWCAKRFESCFCLIEDPLYSF